jgi:hypothetical protein
VFNCVLIHVAILKLKMTDKATERIKHLYKFSDSHDDAVVNINQFSFKVDDESQKGSYYLYYEGCFKLIIPDTVYYSFLRQSNTSKRNRLDCVPSQISYTGRKVSNFWPKMALNCARKYVGNNAKYTIVGETVSICGVRDIRIYAWDRHLSANGHEWAGFSTVHDCSSCWQTCSQVSRTTEYYI